MKINITEKEFRLLVEALSLSDWMIHAHVVDPKKRHEEHRALLKSIYAYYEAAHAEDIINFDEELDEYCITQDHERYIHDRFIDRYDDEVFWDQLMDRLAERDLINEMGAESFQSMDGIDRIMKLEEIRERYGNEFEQHGLEHVKIDYDNLVIN